MHLGLAQRIWFNIRVLLFPPYAFPRAPYFFFQFYPWSGFRIPECIVSIFQMFPDFKIRNSILAELLQF